MAQVSKGNSVAAMMMMMALKSKTRDSQRVSPTHKQHTRARVLAIALKLSD